ncbi:hypothetical protein TNCV_1039521 [Trichonephila clavipes]|uniref:Uncharacterized protein n=1 Tax=Trichonephila clavipes TaxID=2585209 RepID=A0A8X6VWB3_TRICX|nr:hypothetical protein TNCV_1039521 [Trichonephila clavipes]
MYERKRRGEVLTQQIRNGRKDEVFIENVVDKLSVNISVTSLNHSMAFGDGPRNLELWSSDEDDIRARTPSNFCIIPMGGRLSFDR